MLRDEGAGGLYGGAVSKSMHSVSSSFLYFLAFSAFKRTYEERMKTKISVERPFAGGGKRMLQRVGDGTLRYLHDAKTIGKQRCGDVDENRWRERWRRGV